MAKLNYATEYLQALEQMFPYVLYFGDLFATPNNGRFRWVNSRVIEVPTISTTGRTDGDRDTIGTRKRNYNNEWKPLTLENHRQWQTLVHPRDIAETKGVVAIGNITKVYNEEQKFPEMDAYTISTLYSEWGKLNHTADATVLSVANVLSVFDDMMMNMDNARVPAAGRVLYVTNEVKKMLKNAEQVQRYIDVGKKNADIDRTVSRIDEVKIIGVPSTLMKSKYTFDKGYKVAADADQINMLLVHPSAVITPVSYSFATLDAPSAVTEGKYIYFEESDEDVFILNNKSDALQFNVTAHA